MNKEREENREIRRKIHAGVKLAIAQAVQNNKDLRLRGNGTNSVYVPNDSEALLQVLSQKLKNPDTQKYAELAGIKEKITELNASIALTRRHEFLALKEKITFLQEPQEIDFDDLQNKTLKFKEFIDWSSQMNACFIMGFASLEALASFYTENILTYHYKYLLEIHIQSSNQFAVPKLSKKNCLTEKQVAELGNHYRELKCKLKLIIKLSETVTGQVLETLDRNTWNIFSQLQSTRNSLIHPRDSGKKTSEEIYKSNLLLRASKEKIEQLNGFYKQFFLAMWNFETLRPYISKAIDVKKLFLEEL